MRVAVRSLLEHDSESILGASSVRPFDVP